MPRLRVDPSYERASRRLPKDVQHRASKALVKFLANPKSPGLHFERLKGREGYFSIRASLQYRILLRQERDDDGALFAVVDIGTHQVYRRR